MILFCTSNIQIAKPKHILFFDYVYLLKNIRNNLLNAKKFIFPEFLFCCLQEIIASKEGYIAWEDPKENL